MKRSEQLERKSQDLIVSATKGDKNALEQLIRLHEPFIYNVTYQYRPGSVYVGKAKAMEAAGKMQTNARLFDPKYSATIAKYASEVAEEVADIVDRKYIEFFQKHPTKEDFKTQYIVEESLEDPDLHRHFNTTF